MHVTTRKHNAQGGFTIIELMIVVALIAVIAAIAIPMFLRSRLSANESSAIAMLKAIQAAQYQVQSVSAIDSDGDGAGEYAYLGELTGSVPARVYDHFDDEPGPGGPGDELDPTMISEAIGSFQADASDNGVISKSGYAYKLFLPGETFGGVTPALPEAETGGMGDTAPDADNCETFWACYAWPLDAARTGQRAFFVNQEGEILQFHNRNGQYEGITSEASVPTFDAALTTAGDMTAPLAVGQVGSDGNIWAPVK